MAMRAYPWGELERVPKRTLYALRALRRRLWSALRPEDLAGALSELVGAEVTLRARTLDVGAPRERYPEVALACGGVRIRVGAAPDLVMALIGRLLGRSFALSRQDAELDPALFGALAALAVEVAGRVADEPVTLDPATYDEAPALVVEASVSLDARPYAAYALVSSAAAPTEQAAKPALSELGRLELGLPLVVALSFATRSELAGLALGSAWLPGEGAWTNARGQGRGVLAAPLGERGVWVDLTPDGRIVLRGETAELVPDASGSKDPRMAEANGNDTLTDAVLDAPVVVRVELGVVSMPAAEWAKLRPGDVIETGLHVAEPVVLRIAGRAVARGELVDVEGELGVRVRELLGE